MADTDTPWYGEGLRFECQEGCVACCTGSGGYVWVTNEEIDAIAARHGIDRIAFKRDYCDRYGTRWSIKEHPKTGDCLFLDRAGGCTIYEARPRQCRTFPFWSECISSPAAWERTAADCPGCNKGAVHPHAEIAAAAAVATGRRARRERLYRVLRELYRDADDAVTEAGGTCALSGACCDLPRRQEARQVSSVEIALLTEDREWSAEQLEDKGAEHADCPFFKAGRCTAHEVRPLACRVYSCASGYLGEAHQRILERYRREIQRLEPMFGIELNHGELRAMLLARAHLRKDADPITGL